MLKEDLEKGSFGKCDVEVLADKMMDGDNSEKDAAESYWMGIHRKNKLVAVVVAARKLKMVAARRLKMVAENLK